MLLAAVIALGTSQKTLFDLLGDARPEIGLQARWGEPTSVNLADAEWVGPGRGIPPLSSALSLQSASLPRNWRPNGQYSWEDKKELRADHLFRAVYYTNGGLRLTFQGWEGDIEKALTAQEVALGLIAPRGYTAHHWIFKSHGIRWSYMANPRQPRFGIDMAFEKTSNWPRQGQTSLVVRFEYDQIKEVRYERLPAANDPEASLAFIGIPRRSVKLAVISDQQYRVYDAAGKWEGLWDRELDSKGATESCNVWISPVSK